MNKEKIIEGNELIAEYLDNEVIVDDGQHTFKYIVPNDLNKYQLLFQGSWDWLRPVIIRVIKHIDSLSEKHWADKGSDFYFYFRENVIEKDIKDVFENIVEFIKWYNENVKD